MGNRRRGVGVAALSLILLTAACASAPRGERVYVRYGPPVERVDVIGAAPGPGYVWIKGFWRWDGRSYLWVPGRWVVPDRGYHRWQAGHWVHDRHGWYWVDGRWR